MSHQMLRHVFTQAGNGGAWMAPGKQDIASFASLASVLAQGVEGTRPGITRGLHQIKEGIDLAEKLKVGAAVVSGTAALASFFAPNPVTSPVAMAAAVTSAIAQVSELMLESAYKKFDCENVLHGN